MLPPMNLYTIGNNNPHRKHTINQYTIRKNETLGIQDNKNLDNKSNLEVLKIPMLSPAKRNENIYSEITSESMRMNKKSLESAIRSKTVSDIMEMFDSGRKGTITFSKFMAVMALWE